jgi:hypothetical protein
MTDIAFDAANYAEFDIPKGKIISKKAPLVLLPLEMLAHMEPDEGLAKESAKWGKSHAQALFEVMRAQDDLSMDSLASHLHGAIALSGLGRATVELWSDALLVKVDTSVDSKISSSHKVLIEGFVSGYISGLSQKPFDAKIVEETGSVLILFVGNTAALAFINQLIKEGKSSAEAVLGLTSKGAI